MFCTHKIIVEIPGYDNIMKTYESDKRFQSAIIHLALQTKSSHFLLESWYGASFSELWYNTSKNAYNYLIIFTFLVL